MTPKLKPPGTKRLTLKYDMLLSNFAFKFNLRRHMKAEGNPLLCGAVPPGLVVDWAQGIRP
jgi:hypothetical protein